MTDDDFIRCVKRLRAQCRKMTDHDEELGPALFHPTHDQAVLRVRLLLATAVSYSIDPREFLAAVKEAVERDIWPGPTTEELLLNPSLIVGGEP